jgi:hypothetical protein
VQTGYGGAIFARGAIMTSWQLGRAGGLQLMLGAAAFVVHIFARSLLTAGVDPMSFARHALWVPVNALGCVGAVLLIVGLPVVYGSLAARAGVLGLVGVLLIALAWSFFGVFLSLYGALVMPWLADNAPALVAAPAPRALVLVFALALLAWLVGGLMLAVPFARGGLGPSWIGYLLPASALWMIVGNLVIAPAGPVANLALNLLSNLGPVLLAGAFGAIGARAWTRSLPAQAAISGPG